MMTSKFQDVFKRYKDIVLYGFFGVMTTLVNILSYWIMVRVFMCPVMCGSVIAWITAVLFAYVTNRKWVFHSAAAGFGKVTKEIGSFFLCRLATGVLDWGCMYVFVEVFHFNDMLIKTISNIIVILVNYLASKLIIFTADKN